MSWEITIAELTEEGEIACSSCHTATDILPEEIKKGLSSFRCEVCGVMNALNLERDIWPLHGIKSMKGYSWG